MSSFATDDNASDGAMLLLLSLFAFIIAAYAFFAAFIIGADLVSRDNLTAALRGQLRQGGGLVLRPGFFGPHRPQLALAGRLSSVRRHRRRQKGC